MGSVLEIEISEEKLKQYNEEFLNENKQSDKKVNLIELYGKYKLQSEIGQTFSHFSYEHTEGNYMIIDLQGDIESFTDPIVLKKNREYEEVGEKEE